MTNRTKDTLSGIGIVLFFAALIVAMLLLTSGCMYNNTETCIWADGGSYVTTDAGAQAKPVTSGAQLGDAAVKAGAALAGAGAGGAVAGVPGAIAGAGAGLLTEKAVNTDK